MKRIDQKKSVGPKLISGAKSSKFTASRAALAVSFKTLDREQCSGDKQKALRLFCRAMIRVYLLDKQQNGKRLGIL
jgi:hypothetical protein